MRTPFWFPLAIGSLLALNAAATGAAQRSSSNASLQAATHREIARTYSREGKLKQAQAELEKATRLGIPDDYQTDCCRGWIAAQCHDWRESADSYQKVLRRRPDLPGALTGLAFAEAHLGHVKEGRALADKALRVDPRYAGSHCCAAWFASERGDWPAAVTAYRRAISLDTNHAYSHLRLAEAYLETDQLTKARTELREASKKDPGSAYNHCCFARLSGEDEDWRTAAREYQTALRLNPSLTPGYVRLASALGHLRRFDEALRAAQRAATKDPKDPNALCCQGWIYSEMKEWRKAENSLRRARQMGSTEAELHRRLGWVLYGQKRFKEFLAEGRAAVQADPENERSHCCLGRAYDALGQRQKALQERATGAALSADPGRSGRSRRPSFQ